MSEQNGTRINPPGTAPVIALAKSLGAGRRLVGGEWIFSDAQLVAFHDAIISIALGKASSMARDEAEDLAQFVPGYGSEKYEIQADALRNFADVLQRAMHDNESLSVGNHGEPKACTPAEERGIVGATGAGQLPATAVENRDSAERRSPDGTASTLSLDESNQHLVEMRLLLSRAAGLITLATDLKPISDWQRDVVRRAEDWLKDYYRTVNHA